MSVLGFIRRYKMAAQLEKPLRIQPDYASHDILQCNAYRLDGKPCGARQEGHFNQFQLCPSHLPVAQKYGTDR